MKTTLLFILLTFSTNYLLADVRSVDLLPGDYNCSVTGKFEDQNSIPNEVIVEEFIFTVNENRRVTGSYKISADCPSSTTSSKSITPGTCQQEKSFKAKLKRVSTNNKNNITRAFIERKLLKNLALKLRLRVGGWSDLKSMRGYLIYKQDKNVIRCVLNGTIIIDR